jgi:hypothetical protein
VLRKLASSETWVLIALGAVCTVLVLWLTTHFLEALTNPVQSAIDLVRFGPKSRP